MSAYKERLAVALLSSQALQFHVDEPYRWTSGHLMPVYTDIRQLTGDSQTRKIIYEALAKLIEEFDLRPDWIAGTAVGGIPYATGLADLLDLPLCFVRAAKKTHGRARQVEGLPSTGSFSGARVVLIEDVVSTGASLMRGVQALHGVQGQLTGCLTVFDYGFPADLRAELECFDALLRFDDVIEVASTHSYIDEKDAAVLAAWARNPFTWGTSRA